MSPPSCCCCCGFNHAKLFLQRTHTTRHVAIGASLLAIPLSIVAFLAAMTAKLNQQMLCAGSGNFIHVAVLGRVHHDWMSRPRMWLHDPLCGHVNPKLHLSISLKISTEGLPTLFHFQLAQSTQTSQLSAAASACAIQERVRILGFTHTRPEQQVGISW